MSRRPWPAHADGGGGSLELCNPRADNNAPEVWAASDESSRSTWQTYTYRNMADPALRPTNFVEFCLGLLDDGEFLLDDVSVIEAPGGAARQLIKNGTFETGATYWRCTGNHDGSSVVADPDSPGNHALRVVAVGSTETMLNHIETTLTNGTVMAPGTLSNIFLTDDLSLPTQWRLPDTSMPAASYLLIWADGNTNQGPLHAPFKLSGNGEQVGLACAADQSTVSIHTCTFGPQTDNVSYGLNPGGAVGAWYFLTPTPGTSNLLPEPLLGCAAVLAAALRRRRHALLHQQPAEQ